MPDEHSQMPIYRIEISPNNTAGSPDQATARRFQAAGLHSVTAVYESRLFFLDGELAPPQLEQTLELLVDPVAETASVARTAAEIPEPSAGVAIEVHLKPGVMDPAAQSTLAELQAEGLPVQSVRTARRYVVLGVESAAVAASAALKCVANDCIETVFAGTAGIPLPPQPPATQSHLRRVELLQLDADGLARLSREGHLFLSLDEMRAIQKYFRQRGQDPTDLELETLAQTWSEHCVHKTLKSEVVYRGAPMGVSADAGQPEAVELRYDNLLKDTIVRATQQIMKSGRGPHCLSVFTDNAGIIAFDDEYGIAFKVETHNHPSAIEPYGGAATGVGGCIRDVIGCGRGARPIANTDVFCVAPVDWPADRLPSGVLHPQRVLDGVVRGVADYGNRMGIPTVNGAVHFDARYLANPLVYCGCVGLIPRDKINKRANPGDIIVLLGGRTGRDGIHGATFSSAELTDTHADEFSHAVQIGNAITEKRALDAILRARDAAAGCLFSAITDCGAGGLSSAVGEMGAEIGATVELSGVPLKYAGLRYDEIWISEAQERMILAVPPEHLPQLLEIAREEEIEATPIGTFGCAQRDPTLTVCYHGEVVGQLDMRFLHDGIPRRTVVAEWSPNPAPHKQQTRTDPKEWLTALRAQLARPNILSRERIIRRYDHEVQGGSAVKPLGGPGTGPNDAAVLRPILASHRGIAIACGLAPQHSHDDPYWMAAASIDEALRNVVCVGGDPARTAILDNFCWGRCDDPRSMGALVRACQACHDIAVAYGTPFISGKDSLNNEFALRAEDVSLLLSTLQALADARPTESWSAALPAIERQVRQTSRLSIPATLLISALSIVDDVRRCVSADLKHPGGSILLVGGLPIQGFDPAQSRVIHRAVAAAIREGLVRACHDISEGGWLVSLAEMAIGGRYGATLDAHAALPEPFEELAAGYVLEAASKQTEMFLLDQRVPMVRLGSVSADAVLTIGANEIELRELERAWRSDLGI